jgi:hypothetical protein
MLFPIKVKTYFALLLAMSLLVSVGSAQSGRVIYEYPYDEGDKRPTLAGKILKYPVNLFLDAIDIVDFNLGFGFGFHVNAHATRALQVGFGASTTSEIGAAPGKREFGIYQETQSEFSLLMLSLNTFRNTTTGVGNVRDYWSATEPDRLYLIKRSYLGIGADITAAIVSIGMEFHPDEMVDFVLGIFFLDIMGDNI